ncbi:hypothetical protein F5B20DRAFT_563668 [Whalleya microplaca]|nr:hypothetical protein F5B20DRAFT_563668 [Whalleya microplaca]
MASIPIDLCAIPAIESPDGKYNLENPTTLAPMTLSVGVILATISVILTLTRTYMNRRKLGSADYCALAACVINVAFTGDILAQIKYNRHLWDIPACWITGTYLKILYVQTTLFAPVFFTSKASIFLLYRQIFGVERHIRIAVNLGLIFSLLLYLPNIPLSAVLDAPPIGTTWDSFTTSTQSRKMIPWGIVQSSISILLDLYIFFLPLPVIVKLNMPFRRRLQVFGIFTTALMGIIASVLSLVYRVRLLHTMDATWWSTVVAVCALVETNVAIIVSCMPALAQLLKLHFGASTFFKSLRSRLLGLTGGSDKSPSADGSTEDRPKLATFGAAQSPRRRNYYELTDTALLNT